MRTIFTILIIFLTASNLYTSYLLRVERDREYLQKLAGKSKPNEGDE